MKEKKYIVKHLDCAHCAAKVEEMWNQHPKVEKAVIVFATGTLYLTAQQPDALIPELQRLARTVEPELEIVKAEEEHSHDHTSHAGELWFLAAGAALFAVGIAFSAFGWGIPAIGSFVAAYLLLGGDVLFGAARNLCSGHVFDEKFLMSIATLGAFAIGEYPEAVGVMLFYKLGEYFEHRAMERNRKQIMAAVDMRPQEVTWLFQDTWQVLPADQAAVGDILLVRPGDRIPLDAVVVSGESQLDTAPITGEPMPLAVGQGDRVISGCVNLSGQLTVRVEKVLSESMVSRILQSVEHAAAGKPKIDRFITRFAKIYTPVVVGLAALVAVIPSAITGDWRTWVYTALSFLVMSCPCALVLSVPLAFFSGIGAGSAQGILFKDGRTIETLAQVRSVAMDKTGTLTQGSFTVSRVLGEERALLLAAALEQYSTHPIAKSIIAGALEKQLEIPEAKLQQEISGCGLVGELNGKTLLCGNERLLRRFDIAAEFPSEDDGETVVYVALDGVLIGCIFLCDSLKADAKEAVDQLHAMQLSTAVLTGDKTQSAQKVARELGISEVHAQLLPEGKWEILQKLREKSGSVMFVGDGINDAPVLAGADVGAAMGSGADAAMEAADVVFMTNQVTAIPQAIRIARKTKQVAWQNIVFSLAVKGVVMLLGLLGWASMWAAVLADSGVALLCVWNAMAGAKKKKK